MNNNIFINNSVITCVNNSNLFYKVLLNKTFDTNSVNLL